MNTKILLGLATVFSWLATAASADPPQLERFSRVPDLHAFSARDADLSRAAAAPSVLQAAEAADPVRIDRHVTQWVTFDVPQAGPLGTFPNAINDLGEIAGNYNDNTSQQLQHGFLRSVDGSIVSFDPPGSQLTNPNGLNNLGTVVGYYVDAAGNVHGFARSPAGTYITVDPPGTVGDASVYAINDLGVMTGHYYDVNGFSHGYVRNPDGTYVIVDPPAAADSTYIICGHINLAGEIGCQYPDANGTWHALLRHPDGAVAIVDAPGAGVGNDLGTFVGFIQALNVEGQLTGEYADANNGYHGYVRNANGSFTEFTVPGGGTNNANGTYPAALNIWDTVTGFSYDANGFATGFVRFATGTIDSFQAPSPGNLGTFPMGSNLWNQFTGTFYDANGTGHGFVALATP
jgi:hypothetical protein